MAQAYFSLVTTTGKIKIAESAAGGDPVVITHFAIGDGNGAETNPTAAATVLVREVWRTPVESVITDPDNPSAILVTAIIPTNAGGWWMREFGIFDQAGSMIAVAKPVSQYKPTALEGQLEDIRYEFQIIIGANANVTLLVDPSLLFATRAWVESRRVPMGQLMRPPWMPVISMTLSSAPGNPAIGDTYLVSSNATGVWATNVGKIAEWNGSGWNYVSPPDGHGVSLPDGRVFERVAGTYVEKLALDAQSGKWTCAVVGGTANALTATLNPVPLALHDGMMVQVRPVATSTAAAPTLNLNGLGPAAIVNPDGSQLMPGALVAGAPALLTYASAISKWVLLTPPVTAGGGGGQNGWCYLPGKMILQWGRYTGTCWGDAYSANGVYEGDVDVTWPRAFNSDVYTVVNGAGDVSGRGQQEQAWIFLPNLTGGGGVVASRTLNATVIGNYMVVGK